MSLDAMLWGIKDAPVANVEERAILTILGEAADEDGCNAFPSQPTIAKRAILSVRTVSRRLADLQERGLIALGDQRAAAHIPADRRPIVYDLQIPYSWFGRIERTNEFRAGRGRAPLTPQMRPDLAAPPEPKRRADVGVSKPRRGDQGKAEAEPTGGLQVTPEESGETTGLEVRPDSQSTTTGLVVHDDLTSSRTTPSLTQSLNPENPLPLPEAPLTKDSPAQDQGEGDASGTENDLAEVVARVAKARPDWSPATIEEAITTAMHRGRTLAACSAAMTTLIDGTHGLTKSPRRLNSSPTGPWWTAAAPTPPAPRQPATYCDKPGHERTVVRAEGCPACIADQKAGYTPDVEITDADREATLALREKTRQGAAKLKSGRSPALAGR